MAASVVLPVRRISAITARVVALALVTCSDPAARARAAVSTLPAATGRFPRGIAQAGGRPSSPAGRRTTPDGPARDFGRGGAVWPALVHNELVISGAALIVACVLAFLPHAAGRGRDGIGRGDSLRPAIDPPPGPIQPRSKTGVHFIPIGGATAVLPVQRSAPPVSLDRVL